MPSSAEPLPTSLSVYRGQSHTGIGDGPDRPIGHGEQYLAADPPLQRAELLAGIRPWLTLDSEPADHQRLHDELESWSCFRHEDLLFVVRLTPAGTYDRRTAYFAHGRSWPVDGSPSHFDPGAHLGRSELFERPWRNGQRGERVVESWPLPVRPEQLGAEPEVAARLLAHYFQACEQGYPLIVAVPIAEFRIGQPLHALVGFARAGLPADLKRHAAVRVFTRLPQVFLNELGANLIVVPTDVAGAALGAGRTRHATLLDRQAEVKDGREVEDRFLAYARAVLEGTLQIPAGLLPFAERFGRLHRDLGLPRDADVRMVHLGYNLALAMAGAEGERERFFREYLLGRPELLAGLPVERLVAAEEWTRFPRELLADFILRSPQDLEPSQRVLQQVVSNALSRTPPLDGAVLAAWWDPADETKLRRLLELLAGGSPLIDAGAAAQRTVEIPVARLAASGRPSFGVLKAELAAGVIGRRARESADLAELAADTRSFAVLAKATSEGQLDPAWAAAFVRSAEPGKLSAAAIRLFQDVQGWAAWETVPKLLLNRLRSLKKVPADLSRPIMEASQVLDPLRDFSVYIRMADLFALNRPGETNPLLARLQEALPALDDPGKAHFLMEIALDEGWVFLWPRDLVRDGDLLLPYNAEIAGAILASSEMRDLLDANALLKLAAAAGDDALETVFAMLDQCLTTDPAAATAALVRQGWWYAWRCRSTLAPAALRRAALAWLSCELWHGEDPPEATLEVWHAVIGDLGETLGGEEMRYLCLPEGPAWPRIIPFEQDQVADLCRLAGDLGALAELAETLRPDLFVCPLQTPIDAYLLTRSRFAGRLPASALGWLKDETPALVPLDLEPSRVLWQNAGCRCGQALRARAHAVAACLRQDPTLALTEAGEPPLWDHDVFLDVLADWLSEQGSLGHISTKVAAVLDQSLDPRHARSMAPPPWMLCAELIQSGYANVAEFLCPGGAGRVKEELLCQRVIAALVAGDVGDACWSELAGEPARLGAVAARFGDDKGVAPARRAWQTFRAVLQKHPDLLAPVSARPGLPALELAAALLGNGAVGLAALGLVFVESGCRVRSDPGWWQALDHTLARCRRRGGDNRPETARALIRQCLDDLSEDERRAFVAASDTHRISRPTPGAER